MFKKEAIETQISPRNELGIQNSLRVDKLYNKDLTKLLPLSDWEEKSNRKQDIKFADLFWLIHHRGIPHSQRSQIWRELLKVSINELLDIQHFKESYDCKYNSQITLFDHYQELQ
jgi:hypothetical protein